jgi:hypothetical protein
LDGQAGRKDRGQKEEIVSRSGPLFGPAAFGTAAAAGIAVFAALVGAFGVPVFASLKFLAGVLIIAYFPGWTLLKLFRLPLGRLESLVLALTLGVGASVVLHKYSRMAGADWLFGLGLAAAIAAVLVLRWKRPPRRSEFEFRVTAAGIAFVLILVLIFGLLAADSYRNGRLQPDGSFVVNMHYFDGFIRLPVIRELSHSLPPQMPFAAGKHLTYHYGFDLFIQIFHRGLGLGLFDLTHRLMMTFFFFLTAAAAFVFLRRMFRSPAPGVLGAFLVIFGSGGATWAAALLLDVPFGSNPFFSFYLFDVLGLNSFFPALTFIFAGSYALIRGLEEGGRRALVLAGLFFALSVEFKIFLIAPVLAALIVTGLMAWIRFRDGRLLTAGAATAVGAAPLLLTALLTNSGGLSYAFSIHAIEWPARMLETLNLASWSSAWERLFHGGAGTAGDAGLSLAAVLLLIVGSCGWSVWALPGAIRDFFIFRRDRLDRLFLSGLLGAALADFFLLHLTMDGQDRDILDVYVFYLGLIVLSVLAAERAVRFLRPKPSVFRMIGIGVLCVFSLANSAWFLAVKARSPDRNRFSPAYMEMTAWLSAHIPGSSVVLHPLDTKYISYFADRRVVLDDTVHSYLEFHLTRDEISVRRDAVNRFFADPRLYPDVLDRYAVTHVLVYNDGHFFPWAGPDWSVTGFVLRRIFRNDGFTVYAVRRNS